MDYRYIGNHALFNNNTGSFNTIFNTTIADDKPQVLKWLSSLEPQRRHQHLRDSRLEDVGQWIFRMDEFQRWNTGEDGSAHSVLFCHGDPGVGKTHLSSLVIDHFYGGGQDTTVAGMYCDYLDNKEQTTSNMLGAILKQFVGGGNIPEDIHKAFKDAKNHFGGIRPQVPELLNMLKAVISQRPRVVICLDGLDESLPEHRTGLLKSLQGITRQLPNVRLFLTGRPFIHSEVMRYFPRAEAVSVRPTKEDTEAFLRIKLDEDTEYDAMDECLRADIIEIIPRTIADIFLLVSLTIDAILAETTIHRRREKLKQMSRGHDVGDVYTATLERIRAQKKDRSRLGMEAIMWVAHSERPLQPGELCQALGVEIGSKDLNMDNVPSIRTLLNCGLGLVTVDSSSSTVRLVHFTLQEYILANPALFHSPHSTIAEVCLTYLNFACIRDLSTALPSPPPTTPFLEYASCYWGAHARRETNENVIPLALKLLDQFDSHISCKLLLLKEYNWDRPFNWEDRPIRFTGFHGAALLGVVDILIALIEMKTWDPNAADVNGNTALAWAARKGHDRAVQLLLGEEAINPNTADTGGRTPISWAAQNGDEGIVKMLLDRNDVDPDRADHGGRTPFSRAAEYGCEEIVKLLLERNDVNPNAADMGGLTPFSLAARSKPSECARVVKILLERNEVDPDRPDITGRTPFSWAAGFGLAGIVEMLLERNNVNPDRADMGGRTPFSWAAGSWVTECVTVVKILLDRNDVDPNRPDLGGRTPLSWAAEHGCEEIVGALLGRNNVDPDTADGGGRTPFSRAAGSRWTGCVTVVKILLERNDVDPDRPDLGGRTPLSWSAQYGPVGIVKLLLDRNDVYPDTADGDGRTPLSWAAGSDWRGRMTVVKILLERNEVDPDRPDLSGRTPLSWAAGSDWGGRITVVKILLERNEVDPDRPDLSGRTPFSWATRSRNKEVVKILLERNDVNSDTVDKSCCTPPSRATSSGYTGPLPLPGQPHGFVAESVLAEESFEPPRTVSSELVEPPPPEGPPGFETPGNNLLPFTPLMHPPFSIRGSPFMPS